MIRELESCHLLPPATALPATLPALGLATLIPNFCRFLSGNFVLHVEQTGKGLQKTTQHRKVTHDSSKHRSVRRARSSAKQQREGRVRTGKTDRANISDVDYVLMTEAGCSKVDTLLGREVQELTDGLGWEERHLEHEQRTHGDREGKRLSVT